MQCLDKQATESNNYTGISFHYQYMMGSILGAGNVQE
jgi:hypothetical protein